MEFHILGHSIGSPIRFEIPLRFPQEDREMYPWLRQRDRYYSLETPLDRGGYSIPVLGYPCTAEGVRLPDTPQIIIKLPNLDGTNYTSSEIDERGRKIGEQSIAEWEHVRKRLLNCRHANPIFDLGTAWLAPSVQIYATAQLYLHDSQPLNKWLVQRAWRPKLSYDADGKEIPNWDGISAWEDWLFLARRIAMGLADIHRRRVIHGDIWPPNIFLCGEGSDCYVKFIDFGESFIATPSGAPRIQPNHPYRAPERAGAEYTPTEQIDVYSFGKLLLYLSIGIDVPVPRDLRGHRRRDFVRTKILERNPRLIKSVPSIVDVIAHCTAFDPVARPRIMDICEELSDLRCHTQISPPADLNLKQRLKRIVAASKKDAAQHSSVFLKFVDRKLAEVEHLLDTYRTEMIEFTGTRDQLIHTLAALLGELGPDDSWAAITTPSVWQESALGLDGRYATATTQAVRRGAAVHRTYVVSIEELGLDWSEAFLRRLEDAQAGRGERHEINPRLAELFSDAIREFRYYSGGRDYKPMDKDAIRAHQERLSNVLQSMRNMVVDWELDRSLHRGEFGEIRATSGLYIGLAPVSTLAKVRQLRAANPVSLMYSAKQPTEENKWLLVMTDLRARNEIEAGPASRPELRGVRIYKSVLGVPKDRILSLERLMKNESVNIGPIIDYLAGIAASIADEPTSHH